MNIVLYFNSTLVRLKVGLAYKTEVVEATFQFNSCTIKSRYSYISLAVAFISIQLLYD